MIGGEAAAAGQVPQQPGVDGADAELAASAARSGGRARWASIQAILAAGNSGSSAEPGAAPRPLASCAGRDQRVAGVGGAAALPEDGRARSAAPVSASQTTMVSRWLEMAMAVDGSRTPAVATTASIDLTRRRPDRGRRLLGPAGLRIGGGRRAPSAGEDACRHRPTSSALVLVVPWSMARTMRAVICLLAAMARRAAAAMPAAVRPFSVEQAVDRSGRQEAGKTDALDRHGPVGGGHFGDGAAKPAGRQGLLDGDDGAGFGGRGDAPPPRRAG